MSYNSESARLGLAAERPGPHRVAAPTFHAGSQRRCGPEHCTVTEAIAWFAYRDERIAARYGAPLHAPNDHGWLRRHRDRQYNDSIQKSELPGTEALAGLNGEALVDAARAWEKTDDARWETGADELLQALRRGMVRTYRSGDVAAGFWADSTLGEHARAGYRVDREDMRRVVEGVNAGVVSQFELA